MRITAPFAVLAAASALFGCAGSSQAVVPQAPPAAPTAVTCTYPDAPTAPAPEWICDRNVEGAEVAALGIHETSKAGLQYMTDHAEISARAELARQMKTRLMNMLKQYVQATGAGDTATVDKAESTATNSFTAEELVGVRIFKTRTSPNGTMYVLVGVDAQAAKQTMKGATEKAIRSSRGNENALWQQFKAKQADEELKARAAEEEAKK
jgi:hypothetical protein